MRRLLCIEGVFAIQGRGLVLTPELPWGRPARAQYAELRRPDGVVIPVPLQACAEHRSLTLESARAGAKSFARVCLIRGVDEIDVVLGSELWCDDAFAQEVLADRAQ